jgi:hypothetical protein
LIYLFLICPYIKLAAKVLKKTIQTKNYVQKSKYDAKNKQKCVLLRTNKLTH